MAAVAATLAHTRLQHCLDRTPVWLRIASRAVDSAVSAIAAQVFDVPVVVPEPGEYVARGAAVQAAWALTGTRPDWVLPVVAEPAIDHRPIIRAQYAAHRA